MAFFTAAQLFGNGSGAPLDPGWVPIDTAAPPTFSANNRGIAFGEQLTSAIANRPHYALALNTDDLNTRLALFEVGGLDAAYDLGAAAVAGGGRVIIRDGGAVETQSALSSLYADDPTNAHFRANQVGDGVKGGGGIESVAYGRAGNAALFGFLDRRAANFAGYTVAADTISATISGSAITVGAGQLRDGSSNTHLLLGRDLIEILSGSFAGVYVIASLASGTIANVLSLDGSTPAFSAGSVNVRIHRATFGTFSPHGQSGTHSLAANFMSGMPGQESAFDLIAGSTLGRYDTAGSSADGARYALRVGWKQLSGTVTTKVSVDAQGQLRSSVTRSQLTTAQQAASIDLGAPAIMIQQDDPGGTVESEVGVFAKSVGTLARWHGVAVHGDARPTTTTSGTFAFTFINTGGYNAQLTDVTFADWGVIPGLTLVEIITPTPQAGVYMVDLRDANNGRVTLIDLDGQSVSLPASGAGTLRVFFGATLGARSYDVNISMFTGFGTQGRAAAVFESPSEAGGAALLLTSNNESSPANFHLIRSVVSEDGGFYEPFSVTSQGKVGGYEFLAWNNGHDAFAYRTAPTRRIAIPLSVARESRNSSGATPEWRFATSAEQDQMASLVNDGLVRWSLNEFLREGSVITDIKVILKPGASRTSTDRVRIGLYTRDADFSSVSSNPVALSSLAVEYDDTTTNKQLVTLASGLGAGHTVTKDSSTTPREYYLICKAGNTGAASTDLIYGIMLVVKDPGPRNY